MTSYDSYLAKCVEDYLNEETVEEYEDRQESKNMSYDEWRDFCAEQNIRQAENSSY